LLEQPIRLADRDRDVVQEASANESTGIYV
jgi:hypothetical protein